MGYSGQGYEGEKNTGKKERNAKKARKSKMAIAASAPPTVPRTYSPAEAAKILRVNASTVRRMIRAGKLPIWHNPFSDRTGVLADALDQRVHEILAGLHAQTPLIEAKLLGKIMPVIPIAPTRSHKSTKPGKGRA